MVGARIAVTLALLGAAGCLAVPGGEADGGVSGDDGDDDDDDATSCDDIVVDPFDDDLSAWIEHESDGDQTAEIASGALALSAIGAALPPSSVQLATPVSHVAEGTSVTFVGVTAITGGDDTRLTMRLQRGCLRADACTGGVAAFGFVIDSSLRFVTLDQLVAETPRCDSSCPGHDDDDAAIDLRLTQRDGLVIGEASVGGAPWSEIGSVTLDLGEPLELALEARSLVSGAAIGARLEEVAWRACD
jgi:hypothetical protein